MEQIIIPEKLPLSEKLVWDYSDCFGDFPITKLCFAFLHKNYSIDMHMHEFYEINFVESGEGYHYSLYGKMPVQRGDIFIIPPRVMHGYYNSNNLNVYHILLQRQFFDKYFNDFQLATSFKILFQLSSSQKDGLPIHLRCDNELETIETEKIIAKMSESIHESINLKIQSVDYLKSYIKGMELIVKICELYQNNKNHPSSRENGSILNCIEYIYENYDRKIDVNKLCKMSCMSRTKFFQEFKKTTGLTPNDFLTDYRMKISQKMIEESDLSIAEIATKIGYYDSSHFEKAYKKCYGCLPKKNRIY